MPKSPVISPPAANKVRAGIQSIEVGCVLLDVLAEAAGPLMLRDLAAGAGMSAAKAHRYLVSFARLGWVLQDAQTTRYELGPAALRMGLAALAQSDPVKMARERLPALGEQVGHTLALAVWGNHGPTLVHWQASALAVPVHLRLGDVMPMLSSATGRCFAAFLPPQHAQAQALLAHEMAQAQRTGRRDVPTDGASLAALLAQTRVQGFGSVHNFQLPGVSGLCAPVQDAGGHLALGVVAVGATAHWDAAAQGAGAGAGAGPEVGPVAQAVCAMARQLTADLGGL